MNILTDDIKKLIRRLAIPASIGTLFQTLYNIVDTFYAGRISPEALSALSKSFPVYFILIATSIGVTVAGTSLIGNSIGEKNEKNSIYYFAQTIIFAVIISIIITFLGLSFSDNIFKLMGSTEYVTNLGLQYTNIIFYGSILFILVVAINSLLHAEGDTKTYRNVLIVGVFLNIILNPIFIFGLFFIPAFGIAGLAISTVLIQFGACIYLYYKVNKTDLKIRLSISNFYIRRNFFINIFNQCMPITFALFLVAIGSYILLFFISDFGDYAIAGYGAAVRFEHIFTLPVIGLNTAVISIAGQNFGARRYDRIHEVYSKAILIGVLIMIFSGFVIFLLSEIIISIFSNNAEVIKFGSNYLKIAAFIGPIYPVFFISHALFTALKKTYLIFYSNLFRVVIFPFIIAWYILNIMNGYFNQIFYGLLVMNWIFGFLILFVARYLMIKTFKEQKKAFFIF